MFGVVGLEFPAGRGEPVVVISDPDQFVGLGASELATTGQIVQPIPCPPLCVAVRVYVHWLPPIPPVGRMLSTWLNSPPAKRSHSSCRSRGYRPGPPRSSWTCWCSS